VPLLLDLCAGTGGWQEPFEDHGWTTVGVDVRGLDGTDVLADVRRLPIADCQPDLITASPLCKPFSSAWNAVCPPDERDPDKSIYYACRAAIHRLNPEYWVVENVAQAQRWFGPSDKHVGPYHLWGLFPPLDCAPPDKKGTNVIDGDGEYIADSKEAARIPYHLADALRQSVEWYISR
jgi:hypothetical protein